MARAYVTASLAAVRSGGSAECLLLVDDVSFKYTLLT
jgi:hypothetical protein